MAIKSGGATGYKKPNTGTKVKSNKYHSAYAK